MVRAYFAFSRVVTPSLPSPIKGEGWSHRR
jgi:hypothetical protein